MMTSFDMHIVRNTCDQFGIPVPAPVLEAEALVAAAEATLADARAQAAPDLATATPETLAAMVAAAADHDGQATRIAAAHKAVQEMTSRRADAWQYARQGLIAAMAEPFDKAAGEFLAAADELVSVTTTGEAFHETPYVVDTARVLSAGLAKPYAAYVDTVARMTTLARTRDKMDAGQGRPDVGISETGFGYERASRFATFATRKAAMRVRAIGQDVYEARWWTALARIPGVTLGWRLDVDRAVPIHRLARGE